MLVCGRSSRRVRTILTSSDVVCASRISLSSARLHCRSYHARGTPDLSCSNHHLHPLRLCHHASCTTQTSLFQASPPYPRAVWSHLSHHPNLAHCHLPLLCRHPACPRTSLTFYHRCRARLTLSNLVVLCPNSPSLIHIVSTIVHACNTPKSHRSLPTPPNLASSSLGTLLRVKFIYLFSKQLIVSYWSFCFMDTRWGPNNTYDNEVGIREYSAK
jgi:hypothetical protein